MVEKTNGARGLPTTTTETTWKEKEDTKMKQGRTITQIQEVLSDIRENARDIILPANQLSHLTAQVATTAAAQASAYSLEDVTRATEAAIATGSQAPFAVGSLQFRVQENETEHLIQPTGHANTQINQYAEIPAPYYGRLMAENRPLLVENINHGFRMAAKRAADRGLNTGRMVRMYGNQMRALLSSRYRRLDCFDLFEAVAPSLIRLGFEPISCEITETRMYIKVVSPSLFAEVQVGEVVQYGLVISGSDVGSGMVRVEPLVYKKRCDNGMIMEASIKTPHVGANEAEDEIYSEVLKDSTKAITDQAYWLRVRDVVEATATREYFDREVNKMKAAAGQPITQYNLPILVQRTAREIGGLNLTDRLRQTITENLMQGAHGAGSSKWGLANAFTYAAHSVPDLSYDDATDLERAGAKIVTMADKSWGYINRKIDRYEEKAAERGGLVNA